MRVLLIGLLLILGSPLARADDAARAKQLFDAGRELLKHEHYTEACDKFTASLALDPATGTQLNLAECLTHIGEDARAKSLFEAAAADDEAAGNPKRAAFARARAAELADKLAPAVVVAPPATAPHPPPPPPLVRQRRRSRVHAALGLGIGAVAAVVAAALFENASSVEYRAQIDSGACTELSGGGIQCFTDDGAYHVEHSRTNGDYAETFAISGAVLGVAALVTWLTAPRDPVPISVAVDRTSVGIVIGTRF